MQEETIVELLRQLTAKLNEKVSAYDKYNDKMDFIIDCRVLLKTISELLNELADKIGREDE